jgi:putative membrane protein
VYLTRADLDAIDAHVAAVEAATGVQVVTAVIGKADSYVELPWKAFAVGAALAALAAGAADLLRPDWTTAHATLLTAVVILGAGAISALLTVFVPPYARLYLRPARAELEVRQYAHALFLEHELFRTRERVGVLILVSLFERRVEVLPDRGFAGRVPRAEWQAVVARMTPALRHGRPGDALGQGLTALDDLLARKGFRPPADPVNEIPDTPIEEAGP